MGKEIRKILNAVFLSAVSYVVLLLFDIAPDYPKNIEGWILLLSIGFLYCAADYLSAILQAFLEIPLFGPGALFYWIYKRHRTSLKDELSYDHWGRNILFGIWFWSLIILVVSLVNR